jgi:ABC-type uncharacterized transport system fused permease/ATPase subunit
MIPINALARTPAFTGTRLSLLLTLLNSPARGPNFFIIYLVNFAQACAVLLARALPLTWASVDCGTRTRVDQFQFNQQRYVAEFRFGFVPMRDNVEPVFLSPGEKLELARHSNQHRAG